MTTPNTHVARQIPIVCPGHTRPLAELQFCSIPSYTSTPSETETETEEEEPPRTFLVSACHDKLPMLRDAKTGDWIGTFAGHKGAVWSTKLDATGCLAATASGDFSAKVWDAVTGSELFSFGHKHIVKTVDFSVDSRRLATGGHEGLLRVYNLEKDKEDPLVIAQKEDEKVTITKCLWLNARILLAAGSDGVLRLWDVDRRILVHSLSVSAEVRDVDYSPQNRILTVAAGTTVTFFRLTFTEDGDATVTGELIHSHKMPIHFREEGGASLHPSGTKFVAGGSDLWVRVFDFDTGEELECHRGHHGPVRCVRYAPDGESYATGSEDGTIRLWRTDP